MTAAIATVWQVLWWVAIAGFLLVVVPVVVMVANRVVRSARQIRDSAADVLEHGIAVAGNLDPVPELLETRELVKRAAEGIERYATALEARSSGERGARRRNR